MTIFIVILCAELLLGIGALIARFLNDDDWIDTTYHDDREDDRQFTDDFENQPPTISP
jgi:hypothetical protein